MKNIIYTIFLFFALTSCINDDSQDANILLPELSIEGSDSGEMPVYNVYFGTESLIIDPQVKATSKDLKYEWFVGEYNTTSGSKGELTKISSEPILNYSFEKKGTYYIHLTVTDDIVGDVMEYQVNVNDYFEKGILVIANSEDGKGNLGFIKDLTPEDIESGMEYKVEEHCLEQMNPDIQMTKLIGADRTNAATSPFAQTPIMIVALEDKCFFVNSTTFKIISSSEYSSVFDGFKATHFLSNDGYASYPFVYDVNSKHSIHFQKAYWYLYEYPYDFYQQSYEDVIPGYTYMASINAKTSVPVFVNYSESEIITFQAYSSDMRGTSGDLLKDEDILMIILDTSSSSNIYVTTRSKSDPTKLSQYTLTSAFDDEYYVKYEQTNLHSYNVLEGAPIPGQGTRATLAKSNQVAFYSIGGDLYAYYLFNASPQLPTRPIISYPNEEITSIGYNDVNQDLYVGTYSSDTKRGNVYIYSVNDLTSDKFEPKYEFKQCTDKISDIRYKN